MMPSQKTINHNYPEHRFVPLVVLTPRRRLLLNLIAAHIRAKGYAPSSQELCAQSGLRSRSNIKSNLQILERARFLKIPRDRAGNQIAHTMTLTRRGWAQVAMDSSPKPKTPTAGAESLLPSPNPAA